MKKLFKFIVIFLIIIAVVFGTVYTLALSKGNYTKGNSSSIAGINKIRQAEKKGTAVSINSTELNDILSILYKNPKKKGNITIKTPEGFLQDKYIGVKIPALYKEKEILLYTKGILEYKNEKIIYNPESFKLGKLSLPKSFVINMLKNYAGDNLIIENGNIEINKKLIPFSITYLDINNGILTMKVDKFMEGSLFNNEKNVKIELDKVKEQLNTLKNKTSNAEEKKKIEKTINLINEGLKKPSNDLLNKVKQELKNIGNEIKNQQSKKEINNSVEDIEKNNSSKVAALSKISGQLSGAMGSAGSAGGEQIIGIMASCSSNMAANPSYNYGGDVAAVKSIYSKLNPQQKAAVKAAIFSNVDSGSINELRNAFGM